MKKFLRCAGVLGCFLAVGRGAQKFDDAMAAAATDYRERVSRAAEELNRTRERIAQEKAPLLKDLRAVEGRIIALESEATRLETGQGNAAEQRRHLLEDLNNSRRTISYATTLAHDSLKAASDGLAPGEDQIDANRIAELFAQLEKTSAAPDPRAALDIADFLLTRTERAVGGYRADGKAMMAETSEVLPGTFAFAGPETFFLPTGRSAGAVRSREGAKYPARYALPAWKSDEASAFFAGRRGTLVADASSGKALRLKESSGTVWQHVRQGGVMAFAILGVGVISLVMILLKVRDLARMGVDAPATVEPVLEAIATGANGDTVQKVNALQRSVRELFATGLRYADQTKAILEQRLQAVLLAQRLHYERRLPLLAVIATAAPLMGLLGTVIGMVKTFALITVFGTGNAARLASGISEVLVATELGLAVAIPTLVAHGFLAHRIQKNLSQLERYALQFCTAAETARADSDEKEEPNAVSA